MKLLSRLGLDDRSYINVLNFIAGIEKGNVGVNVIYICSE